MKVKVLNPTAFTAGVFGGASFLEYWPELLTDGHTAVRRGERVYLVKGDGMPADGMRFNAASCFFSDEELALDCIELIQ